jgi:hypothetical protein
MDTGKDGVEIVLADEKGVVLGRDGAGRARRYWIT